MIDLMKPSPVSQSFVSVTFDVSTDAVRHRHVRLGTSAANPLTVCSVYGAEVHESSAPMVCVEHSTRVFFMSGAQLMRWSACAFALRSMCASRCHSNRARPVRTLLRSRRRRRFAQTNVSRYCDSVT